MQRATNDRNMIILTRDEWALQLAEAYKKGTEDERKASADIAVPAAQKRKKAAKIKVKSGSAVEWRGAVVTDMAADGEGG